ncbi:LysM and putative peptidoglycan-binding domain-containing protein 1 [Channa argus]|uniref:LysM and putative peptidoglycan-binding domain-containing protein 1 n=1 Tax=Channa argus TaxID=215402 RepID=A0A6G1PQD5_CHAAH|nr:LysM and putative peptidoglycan-binding domain-containing protein 1 [Channa argus]KAK2909720.1 hypothetical protein Q8A73_007435 [Channa argus]
MSGERTALPDAGNGLLRCSRNRSYGSLVRSPLSPVHQRRIEHKLQPGETLQGLALKYGVSMEQIKRANRLYTNDSIFLKSTLFIPVRSDLDDCSNGVDLAEEDGGKDNAVCASFQNENQENQDDYKTRVSDLTPVDFLKRLDELISQSKQAAMKGCQEAEKRVGALEAACSRMSERPLTRSQSVISSSKLQQQQEARGGVPLTIIKFTNDLRDREDEIFEL